MTEDKLKTYGITDGTTRRIVATPSKNQANKALGTTIAEETTDEAENAVALTNPGTVYSKGDSSAHAYEPE